MPKELDEKTGEWICQAESYKEFILRCEERALQYHDYVFAALSAIIGAIIVLIIVISICYMILHVIPKAIGHAWLQRNKQYKTECLPFEFEGRKDWKPIITGYLIIFLIACAIIMLIVSLYWLGHLFI